MTLNLDRQRSASLQDIDLLGRLSHYFDTLDEHVRAGHGWFIFNAAGGRGARLVSLILSRLAEAPSLVTYYFMPWRDFALNAYLVSIELQEIASHESELHGKAKAEFDIATRISRDSLVKMAATDLFILSGLQPAHRHELDFLDHMVEQRYNQRLATILLAPAPPDALATAVRALAPETPIWERLFGRMYERSLIAV